MIVFLHTSPIHINKFERLVRKYDKSIPIKHFVNEAILSYAITNGKTDSENFFKEIESIRKESPDLIICTCSTYGEESDNTKFVKRIDKPIAEYLITNYNKIGLAFTAISTKEISKNMMLNMIQEREKQVEIVDCDCTSVWKYYQANDFDNYAKSIAETLLTYQGKVDAVFLAQASMEGAKDYLNNFSKKIYTSPEFGVKAYLESLQNE
jgi:hypothetical protein